MNTTENKVITSLAVSEQVIAILNGPALERAWKDCLGAWEDSSPAQRADCRAFAVNLRDNFIRILRDVDDADEQETIITIFYTQVKSQWILINTQSGYQIRNGRVEGALFCRAGMLSALLGAIEPVLRKSDLTRITNFLAEPETQSGEMRSEASQLSSLLGMEVAFEDGGSTGQSQRILVDSRSLESRFRELTTKVEASERQWADLQTDLGVADRDEIVALFEQIQRRVVAPEDTGTDAVISRAAQAEWAERRELQLRSLRKEVGDLRADWEQLQIETGSSDIPAMIASWRDTKDALRRIREELATERSHLAALHAEYGTEITATQVIEELRRVSSELAQAQTEWGKLRVESEYLEREFGTFNAQQMVALVRNLRDKIAELSALSTNTGADQETLKEEFGTAEIGTVIARTREVRDNLAAATREIVPLRADRYVFQNELGKSDAREIVAHMRVLEARIQSFSEMSELLGSMEQALKTLD